MSTPNTHAEVNRTQHEQAHHGAGRYVLVLFVLFLLTMGTFGVSKIPMSENGHLYAALAIAAVKVSLVVLFFMHLKESEGANKLVFVLSLLFVAVVMFFVFEDVSHRWAFSNTREPWVLEPDYQQYGAQAEHGAGHEPSTEGHERPQGRSE